MSKILLNVAIPALGEIIELKVAANLKIAELTQMLYRYLAADESNMFKPTAETRLCSAENGEMYSYNAYLCDLRLENGSTVILV